MAGAELLFDWSCVGRMLTQRPLLAPLPPPAGGKIGLIDYGQSKRLPDSYRAAFAQLVLQLERGDDAGISAALRGVGVITERDEPALAAKLAYGMFDTWGK